MTNCASCTSGTSCGTCDTGFFYDSGSTSCKACAGNCTTCAVLNECNTDGCATDFTYMSESKTCAATVDAADCASGTYLADNACADCGDNCMSCSDSACTTCEDGYGPNALDNACSECGEHAGMTTCAVDLSTPTGCESGYSLIGVACAECTVTNCMACTAVATTCTACNAGFGMNADGSECGACSEGCSECSSNCERSCTDCLGTGRTAPNCSCSGATPVWNATTMECDGEAEVESVEVESSGDSSANILKFASIVLIALLALF